MGNGSSSTNGLSASSTAEEAGKLYGDHAKDKYVIITGSNCGLGLETARVLAKHGAYVTIACRNQTAGQEAIATIKKETPDAKLELIQIDLGNLQSIRTFAKAYRDGGNPLHILINNAGVMACPKSLTSDGLEMQLGVNHMGHFLLTNELLDVLKRSGTPKEPARVVNLASIANYLFSPSVGIRLDDISGEKSYGMWERYGSSKLANILFSNELNRRMQAENSPVISVALHPGVIQETNLMRHSHTANYMTSLVTSLNGFQAFSAMASEANKNTAQGAATSVVCALSPEIVPGAYYANCNVSTLLHTKATDETLARALWEVSEQLTATSASSK